MCFVVQILTFFGIAKLVGVSAAARYGELYHVLLYLVVYPVLLLRRRCMVLVVFFWFLVQQRETRVVFFVSEEVDS